MATPSTLSEQLSQCMPSVKGSGLRGQAGYSRLCQREKSVSIFLGARVVIPGHQSLCGPTHPLKKYKLCRLSLGGGSCCACLWVPIVPWTPPLWCGYTACSRCEPHGTIRGYMTRF